MQPVDPSRIVTYARMFWLLKTMQANWPDFVYWRRVQFAPRTVAVMALRFVDYVAARLDLERDFWEYLHNTVEWWTGAVVVSSDENAEILVHELVDYLDRLEPTAFGVSDMDTDNGLEEGEERDYWLFGVLSHVIGVNGVFFESTTPTMYHDIRRAFTPIAYPTPITTYNDYGSLPIARLYARGHKELATCLAMVTGSVGNVYADYSWREVLGFDTWPMAWHQPGELEQHVRLQREARLMGDVFAVAQDRLMGDVVATKAFLKPLYRVMRSLGMPPMSRPPLTTVAAMLGGRVTKETLA